MFLMYQEKVALILASVYLLYALLLRRETWHRLNRAILLSSMALSLILPICKITIHRDAPSQPLPVQNQQALPIMPDFSEITIPSIDIPLAEAFAIPTFSETPVEIIETTAPQEETETAVTVSTAKPARTVYFQFGHSALLWDNAAFLRLFENAIRWAANISQ